ncbi:MAG: hemerythrin domain-containing protein [Myxococcaceae bacterium]|jgi:iron-sulfur cluster repair protein YtfE (RIC family)|nr:hemerythrin domain-containing protein [Myxococcaceae bacterium]
MLPATHEPMLDDVVEVLLQSHAFARSMLALADRLTTAQADASTAATARRVAEYFQHHLEVHFADEEATLAPRLAGRHQVLDQAIAAMRLEHVQLHALVSRVAFVCGLVAKDPQRLLSVRFELAAAVEHLRRNLETHQAREESILFPAVRRLLDWHDVEEMRHEMALRRAPGLELTDA